LADNDPYRHCRLCPPRTVQALTAPKLFSEPSWLLPVEAIDAKDVDHAMRLADKHRDKVQAFEHVELKLAYFQMVLDWAFMEDSGEF
jgi:hypothetical protein